MNALERYKASVDALSPEQREQAEARMEEMRALRRRLSKGYEVARAYLEETTPTSWESPPAQIPRAGELAMGVYFDPEWNTR